MWDVSVFSVLFISSEASVWQQHEDDEQVVAPPGSECRPAVAPSSSEAEEDDDDDDEGSGQIEGSRQWLSGAAASPRSSPFSMGPGKAQRGCLRGEHRCRSAHFRLHTISEYSQKSAGGPISLVGTADSRFRPWPSHTGERRNLAHSSGEFKVTYRSASLDTAAAQPLSKGQSSSSVPLEPWTIKHSMHGP